MRARPGDRLVVRSGLPGGHDEHAKILTVRGPDWGPPFLVQWSDGRIESVVPGPGSYVVHFSHAAPLAARERWGRVGVS
jgi:hypothetical protein